MGFVGEKEHRIELIKDVISTSIDCHCEKYPWISPYVYCFNNPVMFIDPDGRDVYRYDDKTGDFILAIKNDDDFDQVGKFSYDKDTDTYTLKTTRRGNAKTRIDNIEKGILSDGINFMSNDNVINVGGEGQASLGGVENFIMDLSGMVGKEIGGYYLSDKGTDNINHVYMNRYINNKRDEAKGGFRLYQTRPDLYGNVDPHTNYHTHPADAAESDKLQASRQDLRAKASTQQFHPQVKRFIILTKGYPPINY